MEGKNDLPRLKIYVSEQAHFSVDKVAVMLGFGLDGVREIPVDENFKMVSRKLKEAIEAYSNALKYAPNNPKLKKKIENLKNKK